MSTNFEVMICFWKAIWSRPQILFLGRAADAEQPTSQRAVVVVLAANKLECCVASTLISA